VIAGLAQPLAPLAIAGRLDRLRASFDRLACDALLVTHLPNVRYLTGFTGSAATLAVSGRTAVLVTDGRYAIQAVDQLAAAEVLAEIEIANDAGPAVMAALAGAARVGVEDEHLSWAVARRVERDWFGGSEVVGISGAVEGLRIIKDAGEVDRIAFAAAIADAALAQVRPQLAQLLTESEFGLELDFAMRRLGASDVSFTTIVASGPNSAVPHHRPTDRRVEPGDLVVLDFGALFDGYHSDMTRTIRIGEVDPVRQQLLEVVTAAQAAGVGRAGPGVAVAEVDAACRAVIADAGWAEYFTHGTGHGVGLDIHEAPRVSGTVTATLEVGHVITVEPGVYLPGIGGVRIEDTLVITTDGAQALTLTPKDPIV